MNDVERDEKLGGELALGLFLLGAPAALALGAAADACHRVRLVALILVVGGAASLGTASSKSYAALFWWRALTGVSLGASLPVTFSLLADLFPSSMRTAVSAGVGFGQFMSGFLGTARGWRAPFVAVGVAFLALAGARRDRVQLYFNISWTTVSGFLRNSRRLPCAEHGSLKVSADSRRMGPRERGPQRRPFDGRVAPRRSRPRC
jgi:MFS family permease